MAIIYTKHAKAMLVLRKIKKDQVAKCVAKPEIAKETKESKKVFLRNFGKNYLKLVVAEEGNDTIIVTLHWLAKNRVKK